MSKVLPEMTPFLKKILMLRDLARVQDELQAVTKTSTNPFFKSKYADLNAHISMARPILAKHGFILLQPCNPLQDKEGLANSITTRIIHIETAEEIPSTMVLPNMSDMQKLGAAATYARRYTLSCLLGLQTEDDDGNVASGKTKTSKLF